MACYNYWALTGLRRAVWSPHCSLEHQSSFQTWIGTQSHNMHLLSRNLQIANNSLRTQSPCRYSYQDHHTDRSEILRPQHKSSEMALQFHLHLLHLQMIEQSRLQAGLGMRVVGHQIQWISMPTPYSQIHLLLHRSQEERYQRLDPNSG